MNNKSSHQDIKNAFNILKIVFFSDQLLRSEEIGLQDCNSPLLFAFESFTWRPDQSC